MRTAMLAMLFSAAVPNAGDTDRFAGAWRLVALEQPQRKVECCGMFVFTRDGHAAVQVMDRAAPRSTAASAERYSEGGYEASYGTYTVDERARTFTFHVEGSLVKTLIGRDLRRSYEFSGRRLTVKPVSADEHWSVVWERY